MFLTSALVILETSFEYQLFGKISSGLSAVTAPTPETVFSSLPYSWDLATQTLTSNLAERKEMYRRCIGAQVPLKVPAQQKLWFR